MKLKIVPSILIFMSVYTPLTIIFLTQDFDWQSKKILHPEIMYPILGVIFISLIFFFIWIILKSIKVSTPPVKVISVYKKSNAIINYSIPYKISFFLIDLFLAVIGYKVNDVKYKKDNRGFKSFFFIKGGRLKKGESCRIVELSKNIFLVTERNPKV